MKFNELSMNVVSDNTFMMFGKYRGVRMVDVPADYLLWLKKELRNNSNPYYFGLKKYLKNNYKALQLQSSQRKDAILMAQ